MPKPEDFEPDHMAERGLSSVPEDFMHPDIWRRGYIPMPTDSDFPNINNFITSQFGYPGAKQVPMPAANPLSTAIVVAFDTPPDENYYPYVTGSGRMYFGRGKLAISCSWVPSFPDRANISLAR